MSANKAFLAFWSYFYIFSSVLSISLKPSRNEQKQQVLLISLDGFGWDYQSKTHTPNLDFITRTGVKAEYLRSSFPTTTYPNHFTMVTGLYPESHGIVANYMYDPTLRERFNIYNTDPKWWSGFGAEPLWITNQKQGGRSAVIHWPGYNVAFDKRYADLNVKTPSFNIDLRNETGKVISYEERINILMEWLSSENPPNFIALYFEEPDEEGHQFGPNSKEIRKKIEKMDYTVGVILDRLRQLGKLDSINIIVTSDHGMAEMPPKNRIYIDKYVANTTYDIWDQSTNLMISPLKGKKQYVYDQLKKAQKEVEHIKVYWKKDIPDFLHFKHNRRVPEIFVLVELGYALVIGKQTYFVVGNHGFSNEYKEMAGLFIARGPAFQEGYSRKGFNNVHLYPLLCRILGVVPRPNNGTVEETKDMLKNDI